MQDENWWFMCFRAEILFVKAMLQLGHFVGDIEMVGARRKNFPVLFPKPQHTQCSTMDTPSTEGIESLVPLIEKVHLLLLVHFILFI